MTKPGQIKKLSTGQRVIWHPGGFWSTDIEAVKAMTRKAS